MIGPRLTSTRGAAGALFALVFLLGASGVAAGADRRLPDAAKAQDWATVRTLLAQPAGVNERQPDGATALHWAAHWNEPAIARELLRAGAQVDAANDFGVTPLSLACTNGSVAMTQTLIEGGANPNLALPGGEAPLLTAARTGEPGVVSALLAAGADIAARETAQGQTALMWAVAEGHTAVVQLLLSHGAEVDARSNSEFTPLLFAARAGRIDVAELLLNGGADLNLAAKDGTTALLVATVRGHVPLAKLLLSRGADPNASGAGYTALHWAAGSWETELTGPRGILTDRDEEWLGISGLEHGRLELVEALLAHGADPNAPLARMPPRVGFSVFRGPMLVGGTPFLLAAFSGQTDVMQLLARAGADGSLTTKDKTTPMMAAAGVGRVLAESRVSVEDSVKAAMAAFTFGSDVRAVNAAGDTALHGAAHIRADALVQFLADQGADLNARNRRGETPLVIAERTVAAGSAPVIVRTSTGDLLRRLGAAPQPEAGSDKGKSPDKP